MKILGIETSCDETGVALVEDGTVIAARVATQEIHARWGGVVPEIASRLHQRTLSRMIRELLEDTETRFCDLDGVAATRGPGLIGALLVGVSTAKGIAAASGIPYLGINHLEAHLWAAEAAGAAVLFPALTLLVSGGHTELIAIDGFEEYRFLGGTLDDAAGEAFDKVGGLLGIPYPAGAQLSELATDGDPGRFRFPVAETKQPLDFSYSGLKTAALRMFETQCDVPVEHWKQDFAASFETAVVRQLSVRMDRAFQRDQYMSLILAGGVAANHRLRTEAGSIAARYNAGLIVPPPEWCIDNGAMIAYLGFRKLAIHGGDPLSLPTLPNLSLTGEPQQ